MTDDGSAALQSSLVTRNVGSSDLQDSFLVQHSDDQGFLSSLIVRNIGSSDLKDFIIVRNLDSDDLLQFLIVRNRSTKVLLSSLVVRHEDSSNIHASFVLPVNNLNSFLMVRTFPFAFPKIHVHFIVTPRINLHASFEVSEHTNLHASLFVLLLSTDDLHASFVIVGNSDRLLREDNFVDWLTETDPLGSGVVSSPACSNDAAQKFSGVDSLKTVMTFGTYGLVRIKRRLGEG